MQSTKDSAGTNARYKITILILAIILYTFPLRAQVVIPTSTCDPALRHNFVSAKDYRLIIGKAVLILPLDTNAVLKEKKRYITPEPKFFTNRTLDKQVTFPVSGSVGKITDVQLVKKKGMQYLLFAVALKPDTIYYRYEFYGNRNNHLMTPFLVLEYAQCIKEKYLNRKVVCTKAVQLQSPGSLATIQAKEGEEWKVADYAVVPPSQKGCIFCYWEPALILENSAGQRAAINTPDYYKPVVNFNFGTRGNFGEYFKVME